MNTTVYSSEDKMGLLERKQSYKIQHTLYLEVEFIPNIIAFMSGGSRRDPPRRCFVCGAFSSSQREMSSVSPCLDDRNHRSRNGIFILKFIRPINYVL
jgi:hypothetical protein